MCLCCGFKFSQGVALAVIGLIMLFIGIGGAIGTTYTVIPDARCVAVALFTRRFARDAMSNLGEGFIYWDKHGGARATYWVGVGFIVFGCLGICFLLIAIALAIWACYKENNRHKGARNNVVVAPAPAPQPPPPQPQPIVQAPVRSLELNRSLMPLTLRKVTHQVHNHHYPPPQPYYAPPQPYYSPPPANYYPPPQQPYQPPPAAYDPTRPPARHGDPSSALDTSVTI